MIKFLHTADIHLDSPLSSLALRDKELQNIVQAATRTVFRNIIALAIEENVAALLLAGDIFDSARRSAQTSAFLLSELRKLEEASIPVFYIKGNHDAENPLIADFDWPGNVTLFSAQGGSVRLDKTLPDGRAVWLHGVSFAGRTAPGLLQKFPLPKPHALNIGLLHTSLNGAEGHDIYAPCTIAELCAFGYDYWALGHIHKRKIYHEQNPLILMPGMPQGRDMGEDGEKSVSLVQVAADGSLKVEERPVAALGFFRLPIALDTIAEREGLAQVLTQEIEAFSRRYDGQKAVLRVILTGQTALHWQIFRDYDFWRDFLKEQMEATQYLWPDRLELQIKDSAAPPIGMGDENALPVAELSRYMAELASDKAFRAECEKEIDNLIAVLPPELRRQQAESRAAQQQWREVWLRRALQNGEETVTALLAGGRQKGEE